MANVSSSNGLEKYPKLRFKGFSEPWKTVRIGEVYAERSERGAEDMELLSVTMNDGVKMRSDIEGKDNSSEDKSNYKIVRAGDMVYNSMRMWQGANGISPWDGIVSPAYTVLKPRMPISNGFFAAMFKTHRLINEFRKNSQGMTSDTWNLKYPQIETIKTCIPALAEQEKIADFLMALDQRIEKQRTLVEHLKKYKRGFLQASFSSQEDWNTYPISSLGKVVTGSTPPTDNPENYGGDELFCAPSDVGAEKYISSTIKRVSEKGFHTGRIVPKGTIIVTCIGLIGKLGIATQDMITNQQINSLIVNDTFDNEFIYYALEFALPRYAAQASMQTMPILSKSEFEKITLQIPNIKRQKEISQPLALLDNKIATQALVLENLIALKNGLLQKLFI